MDKYAVEIVETLSKTIIVDAENATEALLKVKNRYRDEEIVLDADDYLDTDFKVEYIL